jgi:hypothetical protein
MFDFKIFCFWLFFGNKLNKNERKFSLYFISLNRKKNLKYFFGQIKISSQQIRQSYSDYLLYIMYI